MDFKESNKKEAFINAVDTVASYEEIIWGTAVPKRERAKKDVAASKQNAAAIVFLENSQKKRRRLIQDLKSQRKKQKEVKKSLDKEVRKSASIAALVATLESSREMKNELGNVAEEVTGDLLADGSAGLIGAGRELVLRAMRQAAAEATKKILKIAAGFLASMMGPIAIILISALLMQALLGSVSAIIVTDEGEEQYEINYPTGNGATYFSLSATDIAEILSEVDGIYHINSRQRAILSWALSKVGCAYDQSSHWNLRDEVYDCSSLAYQAFLTQGIDISNGGLFSAAEECRHVVAAGLQVSGDLCPGDLIFYGGADNGRYLGVYHVAIYVGNGKMVEARNSRYGVVYGDVRSANIVVCARVY